MVGTKAKRENLLDQQNIAYNHKTQKAISPLSKKIQRNEKLP